MKSALSAAGTILLVSALAACERESNTVVTAPGAGPTPAQSSTSTSSTTNTTVPGTAAGAPAASTAASVAATSPDYSEPMKKLQASAQRLREAIQAMAQEPAGERRNQAIRQAQEALLETKQSMTSMPPDMRIADSAIGTSSPGGGAGAVGNTVYPSSDAEYTKAVEKLQKAAQQLRESIQGMAQEPAGERRNHAIKAAHQALFDTTQAMIQLPPDMRSEKK